MLDFFPDVMSSGGLDDTRFFDHSSSIKRDAMNTTMRWLTMTFLGQDIHNRKIQDLDNFNAISIALAIAVKDALGLLGYTVCQIRSDIKNAVQRKKARIRVEKNKKKATCTKHDDIGSDGDGDDRAAVGF